MTTEDISNLNDQQLLEAAKKVRKEEIYSAFAIGFMAGIIIFSIWYKSVGFLTLIPLYFIYRIWNNPKSKERNKAIKGAIQERGLK